MSNLRRERAFTVVEVTIAMALLTLASGAIVAALLAGMRAVADPVPADNLKRWAIDTALRLEPEELERGHTLTLPDDREIRITAEFEDGPLPNLIRVELTIEEEDSDREPEVFVTYRRIPGVMAEGEAASLRRSLLLELE